MLYTSNSLPFSQISLDDWQLVKISGADKEKYLQGQVTADITKLSTDTTLFAAHCDAKGKVWSNMLLFMRGEDIYYIARKSLINKQLSELKKYAVFSKISFELVTDLILLGIAGKPENKQLSDLFSENNNCSTDNNITYIKLSLPSERYIIIAAQDALPSLGRQDVPLLPSQQWALLDMQAGYAIIDSENMNEFLPQALNLQLINGISFDKGCYCGQEMVARAQYRGINKRALYLLKGNSASLPIIGDSLEQQIGENWRDTGKILAAVKLDANGEIYVQAILNNDLEPGTHFRVKQQPDSLLFIER